jgi:signal transduction histidine kinase
LLRQAARERTEFEVEYRAVHPDRSVRYIHAVGHPVVSPSGEVVELVGTLMDVTERKRAERAIRRARKRTLEARFAAVLEERTRLAREMHDTLLQGFTGIALQLVAATRRVSGPPEAVAAFQNVIALAQRTLTDARQAVWDLRAPALAGGDFTETLRVAAEDAVRNAGLALAYKVDGTPRPVAPEVEGAVVRVAQEALANVVKHADARRVRLRLAFKSRWVRVSVTDDGRGFVVDPDFRSYGGHWGLLGMKERTGQLHGTLTVHSTPGHGTEIALRVPYAVPRGAQSAGPPS